MRKEVETGGEEMWWRKERERMGANCRCHRGGSEGPVSFVEDEMNLVILKDATTLLLLAFLLGFVVVHKRELTAAGGDSRRNRG